jgi:hypothetical protein
MPPRDLAYPPPGAQGQSRAQDRGAGRHTSGPGYAAPGGRGPGPPGHEGALGPRGPGVGDEPFGGGYAQVIRASDHPVPPAGPPRPPGVGRVAESGRPTEAPEAADVFIYRDTGDQPGGSAAPVPGPGENDAAYWYDLPVAGAGTDAPAHLIKEARGPFEPLVSSADPPGAAHRASAGPNAAPEAVRADQPPDAGDAGDAGPGDPRDETVNDRARKLEQIKDLYLTAEAIGEANVDKHFDRLLAQQRELISEYFRKPGSIGQEAADGPAPGPAAGPTPGPAAWADSPQAGPDDVADQAETEPGAPRIPGPPPPGAAGPSEGTRVTADRPRAW